MHTPVLLEQVIQALDIKNGGLYIDATAGEAGHLKAIQSKGGAVLAIDWDSEQIENLKAEVGNLNSVKIVQGNFAEIGKIAKENDFFPVDGILLDLGLSMRQLDSSGRGFSYRNPDEPLDMRIDTSKEITAADLVKSLSAVELYEIFSSFSEEVNSRRIADSISRTRASSKITKVRDLLRIIDQTMERKDIKVYARIFQALRIAVNDEFDNLKRALEDGYNLLKEGGRMAIITFHSLEDRIVKNHIRSHNYLVLQNKVMKGERRFERSAALRVIVKS